MVFFFHGRTRLPRLRLVSGIIPVRCPRGPRQREPTNVPALSHTISSLKTPSRSPQASRLYYSYSNYIQKWETPPNSSNKPEPPAPYSIILRTNKIKIKAFQGRGGQAGNLKLNSRTE